MFTDRVVIQLTAGKGGNGIVAWRREKFIPKGGPSGGNGGLGGSIIFEADAQIPSLEAYRNQRILKAQDGGAGGANCRQGKNGKDLVLKVPCGTLVRDSQTGEILYDFTEDKQVWKICQGGKGGKGNDAFKTSTNRAPSKCTPGRLGQNCHIELELKLIADVGLVGFPNAGKSTFISRVANVRVKIAAYPFTTLRPNLGYITTEEERRILIADIPGIIAGAHRNRGLGFEFLRHIERTKVLLFILDASGIDGRNPIDDFKVLREEIGAYDQELLQKPFLVVLNKIDTEESIDNVILFKEEFALEKGMLFEISALTGDGVQELISQLKNLSFETQAHHVH